MGAVEAEAWESTADMLEMAIVAGELTPSGRGWKARQVALVDAYLTDPDRHDGPGSLLDAIRAERLAWWQQRTRSATKRRLCEPLLDLLAQFPSQPDDVAVITGERLGWLLDQLADGGQRLTQTGNLNRTLVRAAAPRFGYPDYFNTPGSEHDVHDLYLVRTLAKTRRLVRTTKGTMFLTAAGKAALADPVKLWRHLVEGLIPAHPFDRATGTTALALLATNDRVDRNLLTETATAIVAEEGWHSSDTGAPPDERTIVTSWHTTTNLARALGLTSDQRTRALELWMTACAAGPPRPVSEYCDPEPVTDFESDPRFTKADGAQMRALAERGQRRWQIASGLPSSSPYVLACHPLLCRQPEHLPGAEASGPAHAQRLVVSALVDPARDARSTERRAL